MPVRNFLRTSPKTSTNDCGDGSGNDPLHPAHLPLQEVSWNNLPHGGKADELSTPRSVVKWLSSSPLPDPPFFEYQENLATVGLANNPSSLPVSFKARQSGKDGCSRGYNATDLDSGAASLRSSASSCGTQEIFLKNPSTDHRSFYASPHVSTYEVESATNVETQVARSLKYGHSAAGATESSSDSGGWDASDPTLSNPCAQSHFEIEEDLNFWKEHNVQVIIRIRPLSSSELVTQGQVRCVRQDSAHAITWTGHPESRFTFDLVACETITQEKLFKVAGLPMVDNCLQGYNSCMFAYGQTGSGKTFTMLGDLEGAQHQPSANRGMTPRVFEYLFARILEEETSRSKEHVNFTCRCSFLEIYNEQILDLLEPATTNLQLREDAKRGVYVENLSEIEVKNVQDVITLLIQGAANRKVAATNMNRESSRSHSVFTCVIESRWTSQSIKNSRFGRLHLVDLAGSERQKSSGAEGERLKEAANINKSLSTLGLVIMSLVDIANGKQRHVPYRDSKLTFLLHDSLGGNSKTTIIANISPSKCCALETLSTLKFAQRAKFIRNNAMVNENAMGDVMALRLRIQKLEEENNQLRMRIMDGGMAVSENGMGSELAEHGNLSQSAYSSVAWDPFREFSTSSLCGKQRNGLELTLQRTLQRQQTAEAKIKELQAQIDQFKFLVKQKEEDTQRGKMMLRFREDKIKRMEALLKGVFSLETYISTERDSLLEEVKMLRMRLERNPEVTRFAMENIRLQEELQRYHNFYEEGERDMMEKEILLLQDQLLEALDWKLMHEEDPNCVGKGQSTSFNKKDMDDTEVESSKLEKQIETVGAVASLQAELIALQDMVISAKTAEAQACEHASSLAAEVERLKDRLKEVEENYNKNDVQVGLKQLECENTQLQSEAAEQMCAAGESLSLESELERQHDQEIEKLKAQIKLSQEELEQAGKKYAELQWMYEASEQRGALAESLKCELELLEKRHDREMEELKSQMHATREELEKGRQAYAQLQSMYEAAERRGAMAESLKNDLEVMKRGHDEEMGEFSSYRRLTEEELEKAHQEYAQLQCMYKAAEERGVIAGALKVELDSVKTRHNDEIEELKAHLHQTRNELEMAHQAYAGLQSMYKVAEERGVFVEALKLELESVKKGHHQELEDLKAHLHLAEGELMKARQAVEQREAMDEALKLEIELIKKRHTEEMEELKNHLCVGNEQSRCMVEVDQIGAICETVKLDLEHMKDAFDEEREESRAHLHWSQRKAGMACQETLRLHEVAEQRCGMAETSKQELEPVESRHDKEMQELRTELRMTQQALEMAHQENARLQSIYKVTEEREIMSETLQLEPELIRERHHVETEELKAHLTTEKVMDKSTGHEVQNEVLTKFGQNMDQELLSSVEVLEMQAEKTENSGGELEESKTQLHLTEEESRKPHEENAQMHCIYEGEERRGLAETLKESELMRKKHHVEVEELKTHIHLTQEALIERSHLEGQHGVLSACCQVVDEPSNGVEAVLRLQVGKLQDYAEEPIQSLSIGNKHDEPDIEFLKEKLIQMEEVNSRLSVLLECAVAEKEAVSKDNQRYEISGRAKSSGNCLSDAKESEDIVQRVRNLNHVSDFAEPNSCCLHILENEYAIFSKLEEKLHCLLQGVEEKFKNLDATLDDATGECNGRLECLMSRVEQSYTDIMSLFVVLDASRVRNKELEEKLSKACSRLRQEEEAKDHAFFLSASDMGAFLEDKKLLQESLDVSLSTYNSKAKSWLGSLQEFESKVQLIRTQLLDLLAAIDGAITCLTNKQEGSHWSQSKSLAEVGLLEIEVERIEEQQCLSTLRVCQQENKVKALKKLSCDIQASKAEWCSREARLEDHLQKLRGALEEKESEIFEMKTEEEHYRCCLDQLLKHEEIIHLEAAALREKLHMTEQLRADVSLGAQSACSMLQLLRREEEKATLLSDILEVEEKLKNLQQGIEQMRGCADKTETAILCADVEREAAASSLQEAEAELDEVKKEIQMLVDTEEEMKGELEMLTVLHSKATSDDSMMIEQLETANKRLQFMKESIAKAGNAGLHLFSEITNTMQNSKVTLEKLVSEAQSMLGDINISIQELAV